MSELKCSFSPYSMYYMLRHYYKFYFFKRSIMYNGSIATVIKIAVFNQCKFKIKFVIYLNQSRQSLRFIWLTVKYDKVFKIIYILITNSAPYLHVSDTAEVIYLIKTAFKRTTMSIQIIVHYSILPFSSIKITLSTLLKKHRFWLSNELQFVGDLFDRNS